MTRKTQQEIKKMGGIKSGQPRDTRHGKHNKEAKKMRGIKRHKTRKTQQRN